MKEAGLHERDPIRLKLYTELKGFYDRCMVQTRLLDAVLNKSFYELLSMQQYLLASIGFPFFTPSFANHLLNTVGNILYDSRALEIVNKQRNIIRYLYNMIIFNISIYFTSYVV
jgi:hypothetical protein